MKPIILSDRDLRKATYSVRGQVLHLNESGFLISAPAKLASNTSISVHSPELEALNIQPCIFRRTQTDSQLGHNWQYLSDIRVIGHFGHLRK